MAQKPLKFSTKAAVLGVTLLFGGCSGEIIQHGYIVSPEALQQIPVGASQDQVLLALGTPSAIENIDGEGYYYISQKTKKRAAFGRGRIVDQRVVAVYFDEQGTVEQIGDFGLKDGKVFDFLTRSTPTGGRQITFVNQLLQAASNLRSGGGGDRKKKK